MKRSKTSEDIAVSGDTLPQEVSRRADALTTNQGVAVADDQNSLRIGARGPTLLEDFLLREKITHFDHERIPERVVHARGYGAHGYFQSSDDHSDLTSAAFLRDPRAKTPVFVRFSTVAGSEGSPDTARDVRGFAVKFYTGEGNFDLVGNNIPVFFIQDAIKFPDLIHSVKPEPDRGFPQAQSAHDTFWDFVSLTPESVHMLMWIMSDRAIPRSFRMMEGFGVHTFRMINKEGAAQFVKFHWRPALGCASLVWDEAVKVMGADPDFHRRDLWNAITRGDFPEWDLCVQAFDEKTAASFDFDVLDPTKLVPEEIVPLRKLGRMVLNRNVDSFFAETDQVAFCPSHIVPGIDFSNDPLLQGRLFSYLDTQLSRLGSANFHEIPVNQPKCPMRNFQRGGHMRTAHEIGRTAYQPNSLDDGVPRQSPSGFHSFASEDKGARVRERSDSFADHYSQARMFWLSMTAAEQQHIVEAFSFELAKVETVHVRRRMLGHLDLVADALGSNVAEKLGMQGQATAITPAIAPRKDVQPSPPLSLYAAREAHVRGRTFGVLVADGFDLKTLGALRRGAKTRGATIQVIAPRIGGATASDGSLVEADHAIEGGPSVLFDAVALLMDAPHAETLRKQPAVAAFVRDAYAHGKVIGAGDGALALLKDASVDINPEYGVVRLKPSEVATFFDAATNHRYWNR